MAKIKENQIWVTKKNYGKKYGHAVIEIGPIKNQYVNEYKLLAGYAYGNFTEIYFKRNWRLLKKRSEET